MYRREVLKGAVSLGMALPWFGAGAASAQSADDAIFASVHPELRDFARKMLPMMRMQPALSRETLPRQREGMTGYARKPAADIPWERRSVPGSRGQPEVAVYLVNGGKPGRRPALLHTHGGGFVMGTAAGGLADLQALCKELDCLAVSVDYRLAPETIHAGSIEDNYAGLKWLHTNAEALGADPARIAVIGESAGGGHAALLAITARDRGEVPIAFQCLVYPMLDDRTGTSRAVPPHVGRIGWSAADNRFGWQSFLGAVPGGRMVPKGAVPARVADLEGLPPAWIGVGSIDLFHDEDVDYAQRLNHAGVPAELIVVPGGFHGFDNPMIPARVSHWFNAAKLDALRRGLGISA